MPLQIPDISVQGNLANHQNHPAAPSEAGTAVACAMLGIVQEALDDDGGTGKVVDANDEEQAVIEAGQMAATQGAAAYEAWFKGLTPHMRHMMAYKGDYYGLKRAAAAHG